MKIKAVFSILILLLATILFFNCTVAPTDPGNPTTEPVKYSLSVNIAPGGDGTGSIADTSTQSGSYISGSIVTVEATADFGSEFMGWYDAVNAGKLISKEVKYTFKLTNDIGLYAKFATAIITFPDKSLEEALRNSKYPKYTGDLTYNFVSKITRLSRTGSHGTYKVIVNDLTGIEYLTSLTELYLSNNRIKDLTPLANLTNLKKLDLSYNQEISDLSPLSKLNNLTELIIYVNKIEDLTPLANLTNLERLSMTANQISDTTPLAKLTNLVYLDLGSNPITNLSGISGLININKLDLRNNTSYYKLKDLSPLSNLTNLTELYLDSNRIEDLSPLVGMVKLESLGLSENNVKELTALTNLVNINKLFLDDNRELNIEKLKVLHSNAGLGTGDILSVERTGITNFEVAEFTNKGIWVKTGW